MSLIESYILKFEMRQKYERRTILMRNICILCTEITIEHMFFNWFYSKHGCIHQKIQQNLIFPTMR